MTLAIFLGLFSALLYGSTDFLARVAGRQVGALRTIAYGHVLAACVLSLVILCVGFPVATPTTWALALLSNVTGLAATVCLYRALSIGRLAVVTPVAATYGAITAVLSGLFGEALSTTAWVGLAAIAAGGVLVARPPDIPSRAGSPELGLRMAIAASLLYGISFWIQGAFVVVRLGFLAPTWSYYLIGASSTWLFGILTRRNMAHPGSTWPVVAGTTTLACGGTLCLAAGQTSGAVGVVTVLSALASGVTVFLGRTLLKEKVSTSGYAGLVLVAGGLALLHLQGS